MRVLVLNCGSSSIKFQLHDTKTHAALTSGLVDRIGEDRAVPSHCAALTAIIAALAEGDPQAGDLFEVDAIGHRVVHGGAEFRGPELVSEEVLSRIGDCCEMAPLHNPPALRVIAECQRMMPGVPQVAVFDTAFHSTIPPRAHVYALPYRFYEEHGVRRYGFHGISFQSVYGRANAMLGGRLTRQKAVLAHLGNGASIAAVDRGRSVDTSMGLTPLEGLVMGTRCGDLDPGVILYMMNRLRMSARDVERVLNKESGLLGLSGRSNDVRDVSAGASAGDPRCSLSLEMYSYRVKKYIGAFAAAMGGLDALVFTAGIGENSPEIRAAVCDGLSVVGIEIDPRVNQRSLGREADISAAAARVRVLVVPADEERQIADLTASVLGARATA